MPADSLQVLIVTCPRCEQRNRIREPILAGDHRCAKCRNLLAHPFSILVFDCETTGLPSGSYNPHLVQLAWSVHDIQGKKLGEQSHIIRPDGYEVPEAAARIHGITDARARKEGVPLAQVIKEFLRHTEKSGVRLVAHNMSFDTRIVAAEIERLQIKSSFLDLPRYCTMLKTVKVCALPRRGGGCKWPSLQELHIYLFGHRFQNAHDARADIDATARCFFELKRRGLVQYG